ncbi:hypothetical protein MC885_011195, partial [Smutsia gigantea]
RFPPPALIPSLKLADAPPSDAVVQSRTGSAPSRGLDEPPHADWSYSWVGSAGGRGVRRFEVTARAKAGTPSPEAEGPAAAHLREKECPSAVAARPVTGRIPGALGRIPRTARCLAREEEEKPLAGA